MEFFSIDLSTLILPLIFGFVGLIALVFVSSRGGEGSSGHLGLGDTTRAPLLGGPDEGSIRRQIEKDCRVAGLNLLDVRFQYIDHSHAGSHYRNLETRVFFDIRDNETMETHTVVGQVDNGIAFYDLPGGRGRGSQQEVPEQLSEEQEREQRILQETNRRLDLLMSDRAALMAHDADGNGMIDSAEWEEARARIRAEVEQEIDADLGW